MKKKVLSLLLAVCMVVGLTACGSSDNAGTETNQAAENLKNCRPLVSGKIKRR